MSWYYLDAQLKKEIPFDEAELGTLIHLGQLNASTLVWNASLPSWRSACELFPQHFPDAVLPPPPAASPQSTGYAQAPPQTQATPAPQQAPAQEAPGPSANVGLVKMEGNLGTGAEEKREKALSTIGARVSTAEAMHKQIRNLAGGLAPHAGWIKFFGVVYMVIGGLHCLTLVGAVIGWLPLWLGTLLLKSAKAASRARYSGEEDDLMEAVDRLGFFFKLQGIFLMVFVLVYVAAIIAGVLFGGFAALSAAGDGGVPPAEMTDPFDAGEAGMGDEDMAAPSENP